MDDSYLPIFHVAIKYFTPFKTHTCFPSICQKRYGGMQSFMSAYSQNCSTSFNGLPVYGVSSTFTKHKLYYFLCDIFRSTIIEFGIYARQELFPFHKCMYHLKDFHIYSFEQINFETDRKGCFQKTIFYYAK